MESLLFAPLDLPSLFGAKILAAFLPALLLTILCSLFYGIIVNVVAYPLFRGDFPPRKLACSPLLGHSGFEFRGNLN